MSIDNSKNEDGQVHPLIRPPRAGAARTGPTSKGSTVLTWAQIEERLRRKSRNSWKAKLRVLLAAKKWDLNDFQQASEATLKDLAASGEVVSYEALEEWWRTWVRLGAGDPSLPREAARAFLDLGTGPLSFNRRMRWTGDRLDTRPVEEHDGVTFPSPVQTAFLAPEELKADTRAFDHFAREFACGPNKTGVHLLSGVRGSGKSSLLNRITAYCRARPRNPNAWLPPLLVRADIGTSFEERKFTIDLASQICQDAMRRLKQPPYSKWVPCRLAVTVVGGFGRWCSSNLRWAAMVLLVLSLMALSAEVHRNRVSGDLRRLREGVEHFSRQVVANAGSQSKATGMDTGPPSGQGKAAEPNPAPPQVVVAESNRAAATGENNAAGTNPGSAEKVATPGSSTAATVERIAIEQVLREQPLVAEEFASQISVAALLLLGMFWVGACFEFRRRGCPSLPLGPGDGGVAVSFAFYGLGALVSLFWGFVVPWKLGYGILQHGQPAARWDTIPIGDLLAFAAAIIILIGIAMLLLPRWYYVYSYSKKLYLALRARQDDSAPDLPYLSNFTTLLRPILPQGDDAEPIEELSVPMLQDQLKRILERCVEGFGRVVVLIDDVDVLPSEKFHELMRIVRPMTKVPGIRCLISVPEFFYHQFHSARLGDLHSTVRNVYFMGEPSLFQGHDGRFEPRVEPTNGVKPRAPYDGEYLKSEAFLRFVGELLLARLRFRVRLPREWKSIRWSETRDRLHSVESSLVGATIRDPVPGLIDFFIEPWRALTERHWNTTRKKLVAPFLREVGHSRREWLREVEKSLAGLSYTGGKVEVKYIPLGGSSGIQGREDWSSIANDKKEDYGKEETSLFARRTAPKDQPLSVAIRPDHVIRLNAMGFSPFHRPRHRLRPGRSHRGAPGSEPVSDHAARGGRF